MEFGHLATVDGCVTTRVDGDVRTTADAGNVGVATAVSVEAHTGHSTSIDVTTAVDVAHQWAHHVTDLDVGTARTLDSDAGGPRYLDGELGAVCAIPTTDDGRAGAEAADHDATIAADDDVAIDTDAIERRAGPAGDFLDHSHAATFTVADVDCVGLSCEPEGMHFDRVFVPGEYLGVHGGDTQIERMRVEPAEVSDRWHGGGRCVLDCARTVELDAVDVDIARPAVLILAGSGVVGASVAENDEAVDDADTDLIGSDGQAIHAQSSQGMLPRLSWLKHEVQQTRNGACKSLLYYNIARQKSMNDHE